MKRLSVLLIALIVLLTVSACGIFRRTEISRKEALNIALEKAGVAKADIRDLDIELDAEHRRKVWEIDFEHGNVEYSYDVDAESGTITEIERERDH